jgi:hypothetical protein
MVSRLAFDQPDPPGLDVWSNAQPARHSNRQPLQRFGADWVPQLINSGQEQVMHVYLKHLSVL